MAGRSANIHLYFTTDFCENQDGLTKLKNLWGLIQQNISKITPVGSNVYWHLLEWVGEDNYLSRFQSGFSSISSDINNYEIDSSEYTKPANYTKYRWSCCTKEISETFPEFFAEKYFKKKEYRERAAPGRAVPGRAAPRIFCNPMQKDKHFVFYTPLCSENHKIIQLMLGPGDYKIMFINLLRADDNGFVIPTDQFVTSMQQQIDVALRKVTTGDNELYDNIRTLLEDVIADNQ